MEAIPPFAAIIIRKTNSETGLLTLLGLSRLGTREANDYWPYIFQRKRPTVDGTLEARCALFLILSLSIFTALGAAATGLRAFALFPGLTEVHATHA